MNKLMASLYFPQLSPIAAFRLVYKGSRSMRWAALTDFASFWEASVETRLTCLSDRDEGLAVVRESERLSAAGSMSGMLRAWGNPAGCT